MMKSLALGVLVCVGLTVPVSAQEDADLSAKMLECREIDRDDPRLACFDRILDDAFGKDEALEERREANFGLPERSTRDADAGLQATITEVKNDPKFGTTVIALDNGQVWQATSNGTLRRGFKVGRQVSISPGRFGSFRLTMEGRKGFRGVKRVR